MGSNRGQNTEGSSAGIEVAASRVGVVEDGRTRYEGGVRELSAQVRLLRHPAGGALPEALDPAAFTILQDRTREGERQVVVQASDPARFDTPLAAQYFLPRRLPGSRAGVAAGGSLSSTIQPTVGAEACSLPEGESCRCKV